MSSTRNKRKRPENDAALSSSSTTMARRRSRDSRGTAGLAAAAPSASAGADPKSHSDGDSEKKPQVGETSTKGPPPETSQNSAAADTKSSKIDNPSGEGASSANPTSSKAAAADTGSNQIPGKNATTSVEASGSSQAESTTPTPRQPLHVSSQDSTEKMKPGDKGKKAAVGDDDDDDRGAKIRGLIEHRSILLQRIKMCRSVAEKRIGDKDYAFVENAIAAASAEITDDQELAAFRDMTWKATQIAKKSKQGSGHHGGDHGAAEKRSSVSLRRGSSVGKRMNAALHSLAPHSHAASGTATDGSASIVPIKPVSSHTPGKVAHQKAPPQSSINLPKTSSKSAFQTISHHGDGKKIPPSSASGVGRPAIPSQATMKKAASSSIIPNSSSIKQPNPYDITNTGTSSSTTKGGRVPNSKGMKSTSRQSSVSNLPLHTNASAPPLPRNRLASTQQQYQPKVHFPPAVGLRAKREMIQSKLNMLLDPRATNDSLQPPPRSTKSSSSKKKKVIPPINPPFQLPPRRKTHWDNVLEEMRWLATDFIEERKWKMSAARTVASSIPGPGASSIVSPSKSRNRKSYTDDETVNGGIDGVDLDKECKMDESSNVPAATTDATKNIVSPGRTKKKRVQAARIKKEYTRPSSDDIKSVKKQGKIISAMIYELGEATVDAGSFKESDELSNKALDRFLDTRSNILNGKTPTSSIENGGRRSSLNGELSSKGSTTFGEKPMETETPETQSEEDDEDDEIPFNKITEYIDSLRKGPGKTRGKVSVKEMANAMKAEKFQFGGEQKSALEFVDKLWANKQCIGAVLEGPPSSGKTIGTCTLLWKHRFKGPQLVVCSPASVVSYSFCASRIQVFFCDGSHKRVANCS